jgi:DNA-binding IclR family transcriptional regulator
MPSDPSYRTAPTAARALRILEQLAESPGRSLTQADLQRQLGFSHGNLHVILATMEASGHVRRHPTDRSYRLGPALLAIGEAARQVYPWVELAHPIMKQLADQLDTECHAATRVGDSLLIVTRVGPLQPLGYGVSTGQRIPMAPPIGSSFISWSTEAEIDDYLHSGDAHLSEPQVQHYREALAEVRRLGYSVHYEAEPRPQLAEATERAVRDGTVDSQQELSEVTGKLAHSNYLIPSDATPGAVLNISSPVFGEDGSIVFSVGVGFASLSMASRPVAEVGEHLLAAVRSITRAIHGRPPPPAD